MPPDDGARYSGHETVQRACSRLGEDCYRLTSNNCEHFCTWCVCGESRSQQADCVLALPRELARSAVRLAHRLACLLGGVRTVAALA